MYTGSNEFDADKKLSIKRVWGRGGERRKRVNDKFLSKL